MWAGIMGKLTVLKMRSLYSPGRYGDGDGLWLQVRDADHKSWLLRFTLHGRAREMGLGSTGLVSLAEAREAGLEARRLLREGIDPLERRIAQRAAARAKEAPSFREVAGFYTDAHNAGWKNAKHRAQWGATLDAYAHPVFGDRRIADVGTGEVMRALEPIWREKAETASRLRGRIEAVLDYAAARGWRTGENPARWKGHLANLLPSRSKLERVQHHAALPWAEVGAFVAKLRGQPGTGALALEFAILTAARTGEAIGATWSEIDLGGAAWTVPAERMKAGREHRVPLSGAALAVLRRAAALHGEGTPAPGAPVFLGRGVGKPLSNMALLALLKRMGRADLTAHGFRSTFRDWASERTGVQREVAEAALAHTLRDKVEAAYRRGDLFEKRRRLMYDWTAWCARPAEQPSGTVVAIRAAAATA